MARLSAFLVWALAAASAVFWGLRVFSQPLAVPPHAQPVMPAAGSPAAVARMLAPAAAASAAAVPSAASARFRLLGVMAPRPGGRGGVALLSIDGQPPRAYRPGAVVEGELLLQQLGPRSASFGPAGAAAAFTLELPALPPPQTGVLPPVANGPATPQPAPGAPPEVPVAPNEAAAPPQPSALPAEPAPAVPPAR